MAAFTLNLNRGESLIADGLRIKLLAVSRKGHTRLLIEHDESVYRLDHQSLPTAVYPAEPEATHADPE